MKFIHIYYSFMFVFIYLQWTYQAMVHELLTIRNNRVNLVGIPGAPKDLSEVLLSAEQDEFYSDVIYVNYSMVFNSVPSQIHSELLFLHFLH